MLCRLLILVTSLVLLSCSLRAQDDPVYQVETYYSKNELGLPVQFISFYLEDDLSFNSSPKP